MDHEIQLLDIWTQIFVFGHFILKMKRVNISTRKWAQEIPRMT